MNQNSFGVIFGSHIKAFIDQEIKKQIASTNLLLDQADELVSLSESVNGKSEQQEAARFYFDPFYANNDPLSLTLPDLLKHHISTLLERYPESNIDIIYVSAASWELFYRRLLTASKSIPEFLETSLNTQQRFAFSLEPDPDYQYKTLKILAGDKRDFAQLEQLATRYDQVYSAALVLQYKQVTQ